MRVNEKVRQVYDVGGLECKLIFVPRSLVAKVSSRLLNTGFVHRSHQRDAVRGGARHGFMSSLLHRIRG